MKALVLCLKESDYIRARRVMTILKFDCWHIKKMWIKKKYYIYYKIDLFEHADKQVGFWSSGMKRRLALACSLTAAPALLLLDEPFTGIDPASQKIMLEMIQEKSRSCTIVFSSHDLHLVKNISTDISVIKKGKLEFYSNRKEDIENIETLYFENHEKQ